jgi:hypothetical protein
MSDAACDLARLSPIYNCILPDWFQCTGWMENDGRKKPEGDSVLFQVYIAPRLCFFRIQKRQQLCCIQYGTSNGYPFQADIFQSIVGKRE